MTANSPANTGSNWLEAALTSDLSLRLFAMFALGACTLILLAFILDRLAPRTSLRDRFLAVLRGQEGTATFEFALVLPMLLVVASLLAQITILMGGNLFVHYSAFAGARSAIVTIPADASLDGGFGRNVITMSPGWPKYERINNAVVFALLPVCGQLEDGPGPGTALANAMSDHFAASNANEPNWVDNLLPNRLRYGLANTRTRLLRTEVIGDDVVVSAADNAGETFGPKDPITVEVEHDFNLTVPWVSVLFSDGRHDPATGSGFFTTIRATCTLTNEGISEALPPTPDLPRDP